MKNHSWFYVLCSISSLASFGVSSVLKIKINVSEEMQMYNSLADLPEVSDIVSLDSELSFMYMACGRELPPLLTDLFIIS